METMTGVERACVNAAIAHILKNWSIPNDGDMVAMVSRINCIVALSIASQRSTAGAKTTH